MEVKYFVAGFFSHVQNQIKGYFELGKGKRVPNKKRKKDTTSTHDPAYIHIEKFTYKTN